MRRDRIRNRRDGTYRNENTLMLGDCTCGTRNGVCRHRHREMRRGRLCGDGQGCRCHRHHTMRGFLRCRQGDCIGGNRNGLRCGESTIDNGNICRANSE